MKAVADALPNDLSVRAANAYRLFNKGYVHEALQITSGVVNVVGYYEVPALKIRLSLSHFDEFSPASWSTSVAWWS